MNQTPVPGRSRHRSRRLWLLPLMMSVGAIIGAGLLRASDHDDGETHIKSRNRNLTDIYLFREDWQTGDVADNANLIAIMCSNPRSLPRQQYFFDHTARYEMHFTRVADVDAKPTGLPDVTLRFTFSSPDATLHRQSITLTRINWTNGVAVSESSVSAGFTTAAPPGLGLTLTPVENSVSIDSSTLAVFAGLREDPFFFDVDAFFRVRAALLPGPLGPAATFNTSTTAVDFAKGYNVNAIVVRIPIAFLQQGSSTIDVFDHWATISVPQ